MKEFWNSRSLMFKLISIQSFGICIMFLLFFFFITSTTSRILETTKTEDLTRLNSMVVNLLDSTNQALKSDVQHYMALLKNSFPSDFKLADKETMSISGLDLPVLLAGNQIVNLSVKEVDKFSNGLVATIFVKKGEDFYRITTSLKKEDGTRAIGTALDYQHPAYKILMRGDTFIGKATLFGKPFITMYQPLIQNEQILGVMFVGVDFSTVMNNISHAIKQVKIGSTGYTFVLDASDSPTRGEALIHPHHQGENLLDNVDSDGRFFIREMLEQKKGTIEYPWRNAQESTESTGVKMTVFDTFPEWQLLVCSGSYLKEFTTETNSIRLFTALASLAVFSLLISILVLTLQKWVVKPIKTVTEMAKDLSEGSGDLSKRLQIFSQDEIGALADWFNRVLNSIIEPLNKTAQYIQRIAVGDIPPLITESYRGDFERIKNNLNNCIKAISVMVEQTGVAIHTARSGALLTRVDSEKSQGVYRKILRGINDTLDSLVGHLEAMPLPAMIVDKQLKILFINKTGAQILGKSQKDLIGSTCADQFRTEDCNTEDCACLKAMSGGKTTTSHTVARPGNRVMDIQYTGVPIKNHIGEPQGALEIITDLTAIKESARVADKISLFQENEVKNLVEGLNRIAKGDLDIPLEVSTGDLDTQAVRTHFQHIAASLKSTLSAMKHIAVIAMEIGNGNLNTAAEARSDKDKLMIGIAAMITKMREVIGDVRSAAEQVAAGSQELNSNSEHLSRRATEQAASVE